MRKFIMIKKERKLFLLFITRFNSSKCQLDFIVIHMILIKRREKKNRKVLSLKLFGIWATLRNIWEVYERNLTLRRLGLTSDPTPPSPPSLSPIEFLGFLTFLCNKETKTSLVTNDVRIFHFQHTLNRLFNNFIKLYWY